jgi:hypothetical protein
MALVNPSLRSLRLPATLLLVGQLLYIVVTMLHTGGEANDHPAIFAAYANSDAWTLVHLAQFASMAILIAGLLTLFVALGGQPGTASWAVVLGAGSAVAALALYGALQAVDGIALKHAVDALAGASEADRAARFANTESIRWIEWGMRSYHDVVLGISLLFGAVAVRTAWIPRPIAYLMGLSGVIYLAQGWVLGTQGFSTTEARTIVLAFAVDLVWMVWLVVIATRIDALTEEGL